MYIQSILKRYLKWSIISDVFDILLIISLSIYVGSQIVFDNPFLANKLIFIISCVFLIFSVTVKVCGVMSIGRWPMEIADLCISVTESTKSSLPGDRIDYEIKVTNLGPSTARSVEVEDTVFGGKIVEFQSNDMEGPSFKECKGLWVKKELEIGKDACIKLGVEAGMPPGPGFESIKSKILNMLRQPNKFPYNNQIINKAKVSSAIYDPNSSNDKFKTSPIQIKEESDLSVKIVTSQEEAKPGEIINYSINVHNFGPSKARNIKVVAPKIAGTEYVTITNKPKIGYDPINKGLWLFKELATDDELDLELAVKVLPIPEDDLAISAKVSSDVHDPNELNDIAKKIIHFIALADLKVVPIGQPGIVKKGDNIKYDITVVNNGPSTAKDVRINTHLDRRVVSRICCNFVATLYPTIITPRS